MNQAEKYCRTIKRLCNTGGGLLPAEYQQVEYLEATGTQYINTGRKVQSNNITAHISTQKTSTASLEMDILTNQDDSTNRFVFGSYSGNWFLYNRAYGVGYTNAVISADMSIAELTIEFVNEQKRIVKNGIASQWYTAAAIQNQRALTILRGAGTSGDYIGRNYKGKLFYLDYYEAQTLIFKMYPCCRKSDNKPGLYDLVTNTFYTNAGTGEFTVGNNI